MIYFNSIDNKSISKELYKTLLLLISPFAPHFTEEIWSSLEENNSIHLTPWPAYDKNKVVKNTNLIIIQVNGKVRDQFQTETLDEDEIKKTALASPKIQKYIEGQEVKKLIYIKGKLVNIVV